MAAHWRHPFRAGAALILVLGLSGCGDNAINRFFGTVGACLGGDAYRFKLYGTPTIHVLQVENQLPLVTARIPMEIGRPCEALQGGSSSIQGIRVLRDGTPINAEGGFESGIYTVRFSELVQPRRWRYELAAADASGATGALGRIPVEIDAASPIQGFPNLSVNTPNLPQATLRWTPTMGHAGYRLRFTFPDPLNEGQQRTLQMHLAPEITSYQLGTEVQGDPVIEEGRVIRLPAEIADARGTGLKPGQTLTVTVGAFRFIPGEGADRLNKGMDWEHRSLPLILNP